MTTSRTAVQAINRQVTLDLELNFQTEVKDGLTTYHVQCRPYCFTGSGKTLDLAVDALQKQLNDKMNLF